MDRESLDLILADACHASITLDPRPVLRAGGAEVSAEVRDALLAKARAGEHVELELDVRAYDQRAGERNRKNVRHRDGGMLPLGRSGVGNPVLRDHEQGNSLAVAGKVIESKTISPGDGEYVIEQTWRLTAPWAVELALRDLLSTVSIGWSPTGPVLCGVCAAPVFSRCYHLPGDTLSERTGEDGVKRKVRDASGDIVVEWIYTSAVLVETSMAPVPAVPSARIEGIRAALSAHDSGISPQREVQLMNPKLLAQLGLAATAGESEISEAVDALVADRAELKIASNDLAAANKELEILQADRRRAEADTFILDALASGRITKGDEASWRDLFELSAERARKRMAERPEGAATPVGTPRQSAANVTGESAAASSGPIAETTRILKANNIDPATAALFARRFGVAGDPMAAIAKYCAGQEGV